LTVAVHNRRARLVIGRLQKHFEELRRSRVIVLPVTEKLTSILLEKPIEIAEPIQALGLNSHPEPRISQERAARRSGFLVGTINRDDNFEIPKGLALQTIERLNDVLRALVDRHPDGDARMRQTLLLGAQVAALECAGTELTSQDNSPGTHFSKVGRHRQLPRIDRVELACRGHANVVAAV